MANTPVALPSGNGLEGGDFVIQFSVHAPTPAAASTFDSNRAAGKSDLPDTVPGDRNGIAFNGSTQTLHIELDSNLTVTVLLGATAGLQPTVSFFDPANNQVGRAATAPGPAMRPSSRPR